MKLHHFKKATTNVFIVSYLFLSILWLCPHCDLRTALLGHGQDFINYVGLWQNYALFAPPKNFNGYIEAVVESTEHKEVSWKLASPRSLSWLEQQRLDRWHKLVNDNIYWNDNRILWSDFATHVAKSTTDTTLKRVKLVRHWLDINVPDLESRSNSAQTVCFFEQSCR